MSELKFCRECGAEINEKAEICPKCGVRQKPNNYKNPTYTAIWSGIITGAGQFYNGEIGKGLLFIGVQFVNACLIAVGVGLVTLPLTWIYCIWDAFKSAERINSVN